MVFGGLAGFLGLLTFKSFQAQSRGAIPRGMAQEQQRVLRLAAHKNGRLTVEEVAMECRVPVDQAKALLDALVLQGTANNWVTDSGGMVYVFQGLLEDDKDTAEDPMKFLDA